MKRLTEYDVVNRGRHQATGERALWNLFWLVLIVGSIIVAAILGLS